jgi:hypothetical protein
VQGRDVAAGVVNRTTGALRITYETGVNATTGAVQATLERGQQAVRAVVQGPERIANNTYLTITNVASGAGQGVGGVLSGARQAVTSVVEAFRGLGRRLQQQPPGAGVGSAFNRTGQQVGSGIARGGEAVGGAVNRTGEAGRQAVVAAANLTEGVLIGSRDAIAAFLNGTASTVTGEHSNGHGTGVWDHTMRLRRRGATCVQVLMMLTSHPKMLPAAYPILMSLLRTLRCACGGPQCCSWRTQQHH